MSLNNYSDLKPDNIMFASSVSDAKLATQSVICSSRVVIIDLGECYDAAIGARVTNEHLSSLNSDTIIIPLINDYATQWNVGAHVLYAQGIAGALMFFAPEPRPSATR
jgi:hypothetical protein